jgi:glycerol-3-phosphate dehydrogenase
LESIRERTTLLRIAPSLVQPLPVLVPTFGQGFHGRTALRAALAINDALSLWRNRTLPGDRAIPRGRVISRAECLELFPAFASGKVTGGALWYDARMTHPERLTLSFVRSAVDRGAAVANYLRVEKLLTEGDNASGALVADVGSGETFAIQARTVLVAASHWTQGIVGTAMAKHGGKSPRTHALGVNVVLNKPMATVAVGVQAKSTAERDPVCGGGRFLFLAPAGNTTMLGTWYGLTDWARSQTAAERGARELVHELAEACPDLDVGSHDIVRWQFGWLPLKAGNEPGRPEALADRPRVLDHGARHGIRHLFSVEGVKYTTARAVAQRAVDRIVADLGRPSVKCRTGEVLLNTGRSSPGDPAVAVREEMAIKLTDFVFRRTDIGTPPGPKRAMVQDAARLMGAELGWDTRRQESEVEEVMRQIEAPATTLEAVG